jgi:uncharacterized membrane protein
MKRMSHGLLSKLLAFAAPLLSTAGLAAQTATFSVQPLGTIPGGYFAAVSGINEAGEAVGASGEGTSVCPYHCAVIWNDGTPTVLAVEGSIEFEALAINNAGQVVGNALMPNATGANYTAVVWNNGTPTLLLGPAPQPYTNTGANAINDAGTVVGYAYQDGVLAINAIEWNGVVPTVLSTEPGCTTYGSEATAINKDGIVVGWNECPSYVATVWNGITPTLLSGGEALAINDTGLIVGGRGQAGGATVWIKGVATSLLPLPGAVSKATAVNNHGVIVGTAYPSPTNADESLFAAVLWNSTSASAQDLNDLIGTAEAKKYILTQAVAINDSCTIAVNGYSRKDTSNIIAFLLTPIDPSNCGKEL